MSYIGRTPQSGNFQVCDTIAVVNDQAAYTMQVSSVDVIPETANHMLVSLNGILQAPTSSYTVSGSTITFASNLITGDVINFIQILGSVLDLGVPSDDTVSTAKIVDGAVTSAKLASGVGGKILQVVNVATTTESSSSSSTFADVTNLTAAITPSSSSNKILVTVFCNGVGKETNNAYVGLRLLRGASVIAGLDYLAGLNGASGTNYIGTSGIMYQDSPSTTSATTYKVQISSEGNNATAYINRPNGGSVPSSTITLMEVSA